MARTKITLPARKRSYRIALTPLADAMFQLLTFFMLTTSLTPYSLITLRTGADAPQEETDSGSGPGPAPQQASAASSIRPVIWNIGDGIITTRGQVFQSDQISALAEAVSGEDAAPNVLLVITETARIQDVASAMEALRSADVDSVQITSEGS